jgi:hypothetical protein
MQWMTTARLLLFDEANPRRIQGTTAVEIEATIMTTTPGGDGLYPVYADVGDDGQIRSLRVDLTDPTPD